MSRKPTYEELAQRVVELEEEAAESKRIEEEQQESKNFLSNIFSSIQDGISILDREYNIIQVNHTMEGWYSHAMPLTTNEINPVKPVPFAKRSRPARRPMKSLPGEVRGVRLSAGWTFSPFLSSTRQPGKSSELSNTLGILPKVNRQRRPCGRAINASA
ncbi:MAG: hypothetical protein ABFS18_12880 [Thermodesulfobacteriota bacterium]